MFFLFIYEKQLVAIMQKEIFRWHKMHLSLEWMPYKRVLSVSIVFTRKGKMTDPKYVVATKDYNETSEHF